MAAPVDALAIFKTATNLAAAGNSDILDLGVAGHKLCEAVIDVSVLTLDDSNNDVLWKCYVQLSPDSDFGTAANIRDVACLELGNAEVIHGGADSVTGRYYIPFRNSFPDASTGVPTPLRYARLSWTVADNETGGMTYAGYLLPVKD